EEAPRSPLREHGQSAVSLFSPSALPLPAPLPRMKQTTRRDSGEGVRGGCVNKKPSAHHGRFHPCRSGNPADLPASLACPVALRPQISLGLPLRKHDQITLRSAAKNSTPNPPSNVKETKPEGSARRPSRDSDARFQEISSKLARF